MLHPEVEADQLSSIRSIICIWKTDRVNFKLMSTSTKKSVADRTTSVYDLLNQKTNSTRKTNLESTLCALLIYNLMDSVRIKGTILLKKNFTFMTIVCFMEESTCVTLDHKTSLK